ncbi:MAG: long-chain fatty acid--CoA ligase [Flavobacterium sp.]|nr:long-chain fatty acid--CoA ligase [Candidatus Neoflavobacterium equi]
MNDVTRLFELAYYQLEKYPLADSIVDKVDGVWQKTSTQSYIEQANALSRALHHMWITKGEKIALVSKNNSSQWNITDTALLQLNAVTIPIYPTLSDEVFEHVLNHSESTYCFVSDIELYQKIKSLLPNLKFLKEIYALQPVAGVKSIADFIEEGRQLDSQSEIEEIKSKVSPSDLASIIYTSGTTGMPKGVMLSHNNILKNTLYSTERVNLDLGNTKALSFLPCCHVFERMLIYLYQYQGYSVYFAESIDHIAANINEVKPNLMTVVPRLLEKVYDRIMEKGSQLSGFKKIVFNWATKIAERYEPYGANGPIYELQLKLAQKLVLNQWKQALGGEFKLIVSGSAALQPRLAKAFTAAQMPVIEGYGLTETSPVIAVNDYKNNGYKSFTVGKPLRQLEIKIAADGEILCKSECVMLGYYKDPVKTAEVIKDGYFHTEDIGVLDADGFLKITDRKKEMFKTSGGKYIAPQLIENVLKKSRFIEQVLVVGEGEKMPAALIQPDFEHLKAWAKEHHIDHADTNEQLATNAEVIKKVQEEIAQYNDEFGHWEQVKKIALTPTIWSIETGELTPTLKLKRKKIIEKYKKLYDSIYR